MTALAATPQAGTALAPPSVLLQVTAAPGAPVPSYTSNFATLDSWTATGTGTALAVDTAPNPDQLVLVGQTNYTEAVASRTVTSLTIGATYRYRVRATNSPTTGNSGQVKLGISGGASTAYLAPTIGTPTYVDLVFVATATSHVITATIKQTSLVIRNGVTSQARFRFDTITVLPLSAWQGTSITRTDVNGTAQPVRLDPGQDIPNGSTTLTVTDYEAALYGPVSYTVTDGLGATATATCSLAEYRRNLCTNPSLETNTTGWSGLNGATVAQSAVRSWVGTKSCLITHAAGAGVTSVAAFTLTGLTVGATYTISAYVYVPAATGTNAQIWVSGIGAGSVITVKDAWDRSFKTITATATSHIFYIATTGATTAGQQMWFDGVLVEQTSALGDYFDGSTPTAGDLQHVWLGAAHGSVSLQMTPAAKPGYWLTLPATAVPSTTPPKFVSLALVTGYEEAAESNGTLHKIIGRADPIANPGPLALRAGQLELWCPDYAAALGLRTLLASGEIGMVRQGDFPDQDMYLYAQAVALSPEPPTMGGTRWIATLRYQEVLAP